MLQWEISTGSSCLRASQRFWIWDGQFPGLLLENLGILAKSGASRPSLTQGQIKRVHSPGMHSLAGNSIGLGSLFGMWGSSRTCPQRFSRRGVSVTARGEVTAALLASATPVLPQPCPVAPAGAPTGPSSPRGAAREKQRLHRCLALFGFHFVTPSLN